MSSLIRDLQSRVAVVTGGSRGIGRAISLELANRGANVVIAYMRNREAAEETCSQLEGHGVKSLAIRCNVGDLDEYSAFFDAIDEVFGRIDIFVSNAATGVIKPIDQLDERAWRWTMDANARPLLLAASRLRELMSEGGAIVALSSQGSHSVLPGYAVVGASKAAVESLIRYLAVELSPLGIRANTISPGVVDTDALRHFPMREEMLAAAKKGTPAGRLVEPLDVAQTVSFLVSDASKMITGQTIVIDGGAGLVAS